MSIQENQFWVEYSYHSHRSGYISATLKDVFELADEFSLWIVDACHEHEVQGLMFIYGKEIKLHVIRDARMVRFRSNKDLKFFIYPYSPIDQQLAYTEYAP